MKKLISLFLLTALLLQLTACGSDGTSQTTSDDSSSTDETTTKETDYIDTLTEKTFDGETLQVIVQH